jgi:biopolymer transport protein ExbD
MKLRKAKGGEELGVQMAPLIDCVFLLLIFFLCTSTLKKMHRELAMRVPDASVAAKTRFAAEPIVLQIIDDGTVIAKDNITGVDDPSLYEPMTLKQLGQYVRTVARENSDRVVQIDATAPVAFQHIVFLIDLLQDNGLTNVTLTPLELPPDWSNVGRRSPIGDGGR